MTWVAVGVTVGGMVVGGIQSDEQQRAQKKYNQAAAENNRYANWTGHRMGLQFGAPSTTSGVLQGGLAGFGASRAFAGGGGGTTPGGPGGASSGGGGSGSVFGAQTKPMGSALSGPDPYESMLKRGQNPNVRNLFE